MTASGYCQVTDIRAITSLSTDDISDASLETLIEEVSTPILNHDVSVFNYKEPITYLNNTKENEIDGSNTTYYLHNYPICDMDNDGAVGTSDVLVYAVASDGTETTPTVSAVVGNTGKVTLDSAPDSVTLYATYRNMKNRDILTDTIHPLLTLACAEHTAAMAYTKIDATKVGKFVRLQVDRLSATIQPQYGRFIDLYGKTVMKINSDAASVGHGDLI